MFSQDHMGALGGGLALGVRASLTRDVPGLLGSKRRQEARTSQETALELGTGARSDRELRGEWAGRS